MEAMLTVLCYVGNLVGRIRIPAAYFAVSELQPHRGLARWNCKGACKACGAKTSLLGGLTRGRNVIGRVTEVVVTEDGRGYLYENGRVTLPCRGCGRARYATRVHGVFNAGKECNGKCMAACGPNCECRCKGLNHGASVSL